MLFLIWCAVAVTAVCLYFRQKYSRFSKYGVKHLPPIPPVGNMGSITLRQEHFVDHLNRLYNTFRDERFVGRFEFSSPMVVVRDLDLVKKVSIKDFEHFLDHRQFADEKLEPFFSRNLFSLRGDEWKDMRSTLSPAFTSSKIKLMVPLMMEVGEHMIKALKKNIEDSGVGYIDVEGKDLTTRYANDVIASCAFGLKVDSHMEKDNQFYAMGKEISTFKFKQLLMFFISSGLPFMKKLIKVRFFSEEVKQFFSDIVLSTMEDREYRKIIRPDMIHLLMEAKKGQLSHDDKLNDKDAGFATVEESEVGKENHNRAWSNVDLIAQAVLFFIAGFETVSSAMSFLLHELAVNPEVQEKLVREIKENDEKNDGKFDYNSIQKMPYLDMVVTEILRMWPPVAALDRICVKDYNLGKPNDKATEDYIIRKGEAIAIPVWPIHRSPEYFPNPDKFDPERFSEENKHNVNPLTYMPFGLGPRNCIGSRFALCEVKVMAYQLLQSMEVTPGPKTMIPVQLATDNFNLRIKNGHWVRLRVMLFQIWCAVLVVTMYLYCRQTYSRFSRYGVKHLRPIPPVGNMGAMTLKLEHLVDLIDRIYKTFPNERFVGRYNFSNPIILVRDLDLVKKVTMKHFEHFIDHRQLVDEKAEPLFARNLISLRGDVWKDMRSTLSPAFTSSKIKLMVPLMVEVGEQMIQALKKNIEESGVGFIDVEGKDLTARYANDVIASCAFGLKVDSHIKRDNQFYKMRRSLSNIKFKQFFLLLITSGLPFLKKIVKSTFFSDETRFFFKDIILRTMEDRERSKIIRPDMIHLLMEAKKGKLSHKADDNDKDAGYAIVEESEVGKTSNSRVWNDTDLIAQAVLFFIAGFETVSSAMSFLLHELAVNPEVQEKIVKEIREHDEKNGGKFDYNSIQKMPYLDMVVTEVLRLWPPVAALDRICVKDYNLGKPNDNATEDYIIRKGEAIAIPVWPIHRSPEYFPNPDKFDPERFSEENKHNINPLTYMPFGLGPRNCIGSRFALCEVKVMAYHLLQSMEVTPGPKTMIPVQLATDNFNLRIKNGHWVRLRVRY